MEVAQDYDLPLAAVEEAIAYAVHHEALLAAERAREAARMQALGLDQPPAIPSVPVASA